MSETPREGPKPAGRGLKRPELPKRFYASAAAVPGEGGLGLHLDGRAVKTPARRPLTVASAAVAEALAAEWGGQGERIDPSTMPITRIAYAAIDNVVDAMEAVRAEIVKYAGSDLVCYRAEAPDALAAMQAARWDPLVRWARDAIGADLGLAAGVVYIAQAPEALAAVDRAVAEFDPLRLAALSTVTTLNGSAVIALALAHGRLSVEEAWTAALVDEDWEMSQWGQDAEALAARAFRSREMRAAGLILAAAP